MYRIVSAFEATAAKFSQQKELERVDIAIPDQIIFAAENVNYQ